jgi:hypothetical protein
MPEATHRKQGGRGSRASKPSAIVTGLLYLRTADSWVLGDASVTETHFVFDGPTITTRFQVSLDAVENVSTPCAIQADFEVCVLLIKTKSNETITMRAANRNELADFVDAIDDVISGDYGDVTPHYSIHHDMTKRCVLPLTTRLQVQLIAAVRARHEEYIRSRTDVASDGSYHSTASRPNVSPSDTPSAPVSGRSRSSSP